MRNQVSYLNPRIALKKWPIASYSVRKVNSTWYNGPLMMIRRGIDNQLAQVYCTEHAVVKALYLMASL